MVTDSVGRRDAEVLRHAGLFQVARRPRSGSLADQFGARIFEALRHRKHPVVGIVFVLRNLDRFAALVPLHELGRDQFQQHELVAAEASECS